MNFKIITLFPELFTAFSKNGVVGQAIQRNEIGFDLINPRDFTIDKHKTVDERPYGGGPGMVMMAEPLTKALQSTKTEESKVIYLSAQGKKFDSNLAQELSKTEDLILICGRYEGIDERFLTTYVDEQISIGDYVLSGGEVAAMVVVDAVSRFQEGVLGNAESVQFESFSQGLLEGPQFTRPSNFEGLEIPSILTSGHHENIKKWRYLISLLKTKSERPDLVEKLKVKPEVWQQAQKLYETMSPTDRKVCGLNKLS
jgi:tRNA (guanine37-N1)-methyltransferase